MQQQSGVPQGRRVRWDDRVLLWRDASVVLGGAPWAVLRIAPPGRAFVRRLRAAGSTGLLPSPGVEQSLAELLLARGIVHPVPVTAGDTGVDIVVPAYQRPELLDACLESLRRTAPGARLIVVDDASPSSGVGEVARAHGATLMRHAVNRGPAAARNTGLREATSPLVAFVDADCAAAPDWLATVIGQFDDPRVAAVAPRITPRTGATPSLLARYQAARSALDMGPRPELVCHGAPLGFLPSAAIVVRRAALAQLSGEPFDERLRVGEDVDLVWRLVDSGALVRYEPAAVVTHEIRPAVLPWAARIFDYGTSAAELDRRHPGRLAPARLSGWNVAAAALVLASPRRGGVAAAGILATATALLARRLKSSSVDPLAAPVIVGKGLLSDTTSAGHLLRREWWPVGWLALGCSPRSPVARYAAMAMIAAPAWEWLSRRPRVDPARFLVLRLLEDAAYGSGVLVSAARSRRVGVLVPRIRLPQWRR